MLVCEWLHKDIATILIPSQYVSHASSIAGVHHGVHVSSRGGDVQCGRDSATQAAMSRLRCCRSLTDDEEEDHTAKCRH